MEAKLERNIQAVAVLSRYKDLSKALVGKVQSVLVKYSGCFVLDSVSCRSCGSKRP